MAIEVVGEDNSMKHKITCTKCAAILEYTLNDTVVESRKDYTGSSDRVVFIECPRCKNKVDVD